jgi:hypothetical protein
MFHNHRPGICPVCSGPWDLDSQQPVIPEAKLPIASGDNSSVNEYIMNLLAPLSIAEFEDEPEGDLPADLAAELAAELASMSAHPSVLGDESDENAEQAYLDSKKKFQELLSFNEY